MKITFNTIHIENFLSIGSADVQLSDSGYTLIKGINENPEDNALSNGAGKTSIIEAINWCLTGETIRGSKNVVNIYSQEGCLVELCFLIDTTSFKLIRTKDHSIYKTSLKIYVNGEDKSGKGIRDSEKLLQSYLPDLNSSLIGSVIILGQGLPQRFTNNTPSGRKEILEKLSKSDFMIQDLKSRISARKVDLDKQLRYTQDEILKLETEIDIENRLLETLYQEQKELDNTSLPAMEKVLKNKKADKEKLMRAETEGQRKLIELQTFIARNNSSLSEYEQAKHQIILEINKNKDKEINKKLEEKTALEVESALLLQEINRLKSIKDTCPTCGQKLPNVVHTDYSEQQQSFDNIQKKLQDLEQDIQKINLLYEKQISEQTKDFDARISTSSAELRMYNEDILQLNKELSIYRNTMIPIESEIASLQITIDNFNQKKSEIADSIKKSIEKLAQKENKKCYNKSEEENLLQHISVVNKMNTLISRDFRGYLLQNIITFIDSRAKLYSLEIFGTQQLNFCLEGNNISISYQNKEYEQLSGGEKQKVDLIVQFSIRDMLCKYLDFSSNVLCLDELTDNLDSYGAEKLFNLISTKLNDVQSIFIISHHSDFSIPIDNVITVRKGKDGISFLN